MSTSLDGHCRDCTPSLPILLTGLTGAGKSTFGELLEGTGRALRVKRLTTRPWRKDDDPALIRHVSHLEPSVDKILLEGWTGHLYAIVRSDIEAIQKSERFPVIELGAISDAIRIKHELGSGLILLLDRAMSTDNLRELMIQRKMAPQDITERIESLAEDTLELVENRRFADLIVANSSGLKDLQDEASCTLDAISRLCNNIGEGKVMNIDLSVIPRQSWIREGLQLGDSPMQGKGVFTTTPIAENETVIIWGGIIITYKDFFAGQGLAHSNVGITEELCLVASPEDGLTLDDYMNHSCDPNLWLDGPVKLIARRPIAAGEELTIDYAFEVGHESYVMKTACRCGAKDCRGTITGQDWRKPSVQLKYADHFSPFIEMRIHSLTGNT